MDEGQRSFLPWNFPCCPLPAQVTTERAETEPWHAGCEGLLKGKRLSSETAEGLSGWDRGPISNPPLGDSYGGTL